jgi:tetratricopeptide (TPR) repeat protein
MHKAAVIRSGTSQWFANKTPLNCRNIYAKILLPVVFVIFSAGVVSGEEEPNFVPDRQLVQRYMNMSPDSVCKELEQMTPVKAVGYSVIMASLHYFESHDIKAAKEYCDYALNAAEKNNLNRARILLLLAVISDAKGDLPVYLEYLDKAVIAAGKEANNDLLKQSLSYLANGSYRYGDFQRSLKAYKSLLNVVREHGDESEKAQVLFDMGEAYYRTSNTRDANDAGTQALEIFKKTSNEKGMADCLKLLGNVFSAQGDDIKAKENYQSAAQHYENTNDWHGQGNCNFNLALVCQRRKEYDDAVAALQKANFFFAKSGSAVGIGITQMELGRTYYLQKEYAKAESSLEQARFLLTKGNDLSRLAQTLEYTGDLKLAQNNKVQAAEYYKSAIRNYRAIELLADENNVKQKLAGLGLKEE